MSRIFVSYRRDDTQGEAGHLLADLRRRFGEDRVFMDIAGIEPGEDFGVAIERAITECSVVLVLIGRNWAGARDAEGGRRLDAPGDWVRLEVQAALQGQRLVVPVLVQGAAMPADAALPESLRPLARRNAHEISARRWDFDFDALAKKLASSLGVSDAAAAPPAAATSPAPAKRAQRLAAAAVALALVVGIGLYFGMNRSADAPAATTLAAAPDSASVLGSGASRSSLFGGPTVSEQLAKMGAKPPAGARGGDAGSDFAKTSEYRTFASLSDELAKAPNVSEIQLRRLEWTRHAACSPLDQPCAKAATDKVNQMLESICRRKVTPAKDGAPEAERLRADMEHLSCIQSMLSIMLDETDHKAKDTLRPLKSAN